MHAVEESRDSTPNPAGATLMATVAFVSFNLSMGATFGPFSVMIDAIEARLHVTREISTLPVPVVVFVMSLLAPFVGALVSRFSLRLAMMAGALLMAAGFLLASVADSVSLLVGAYGLLVAPGLCICGLVAPSTLVTRWFRSNRGRALGIAATPALLAATPLPAVYMLRHFGIAPVYWLFAGLMLLLFAASALVMDHPPADQASGAAALGGETTVAAIPTGALLGDSRFWRLAVAAGLYNAVIIIFSTQVVPFATGLGVDATRAAGLLTIYLIGTLVGTPLVGVVADRIGGARLMAILCLALALWQGLLATQPGFMGLALLAGLSGLQGSAMIPSLGLALSRYFGPANFARTLGIATLVALPFAVAGVPLTSWMFVRTHSYTGAFLLAAAMLALAAVLAVTLRERASVQTSAG